MRPETIDAMAMAFLVVVPGVGFLVAIVAASMGATVPSEVWAALGASSATGGAVKGLSGVASTLRKREGE